MVVAVAQIAPYTGREYYSALLELELRGVDGQWPVRYCADMLMSGHTFAAWCYHLEDNLRILLLFLDSTSTTGEVDL